MRPPIERRTRIADRSFFEARLLDNMHDAVVFIDARMQRAPAYPATEYVFVRYRIANAVGNSWRLSVPLAIIVSEDRFVPDYLFQTVCSFHGLRARAFTDMRQAKAWLGSFVPVLHPSLALHAQT